MGEAVVVWIEEEEEDDSVLLSGAGSSGSSSMAHCRICHEAELESFKSLEAPCSCSGTVKYAHRDCIQRWCDEKGNTICEICLQNYQPGYTAATLLSSKKDQLLTIRESLEIGTREGEIENLAQGDYATAIDTTLAICRSLVLTFTVLLLLRHSFETFMNKTEEDYPFTLTTVLILRASGIIFPMYIIVRTIASLHKSIHRQYQGCDDDQEEDDEAFSDEEVQLHLV